MVLGIAAVLLQGDTYVTYMKTKAYSDVLAAPELVDSSEGHFEQHAPVIFLSV